MSDPVARASRLIDVTSDVDLVAVLNGADTDAAKQIVAELERIADPELEVNLVGPDAVLQATFRGVSGFIDAWRDWTAPFGAFSWHQNDDPVIKGNRFVNFVEQRGTIAGTQNEVTAQSAALWHFDEDGQLERVDFHLDRDQALRSLESL